MKKLLFGNGIYVHKNGKKFDNRRENICNIRGYKNGGKTYLNGYVAIYFPEHPRAFDNGCVYEHLLVAEKMLNRNLKNDECVHHVDLNRTNNNEDNLMVFATESDHTSFHNGSDAVLQEDGTYKSKPKIIDFSECINKEENYIKNNNKSVNDINAMKRNIKFKPRYNICPECRKNLKSSKANMCIDCYNKKKFKVMPNKEVLLNELYEKRNFDLIAEKYGVSETAVRKWCKIYDFPYRRPELQEFVDKMVI